MGMEFPETAEQADDSYRGLRREECEKNRREAVFSWLPAVSIRGDDDRSMPWTTSGLFRRYGWASR